MINKYINTAYNKLISSVYDNDFEEQTRFLSVISEQRNISIEYLLSIGCIFIPNADYVRHHIGSIADNIMSGFYNNGEPMWQLFYIIPIKALNGDVVGIVGWDAYNKYLVDTGEQLSLPMYKVSSAAIFDKDKYFLSDVSLLKEKYENTEKGKRCIFVVDGVFDAISLCEKSIPALGMLGSTVSDMNALQLKFYDYIYVIHDNDAAGLKLYNTIKARVPNTFAITQNKTKDIEERIRTDSKVVEVLRKLSYEPVKEDIALDNRRQFLPR